MCSSGRRMGSPAFFFSTCVPKWYNSFAKGTNVQIRDLIKPIYEMTTAELHEHIRAMRHRREVARPVAKANAARVEKKTVRAANTKIVNLVSEMSEEDRLKLIEELQRDN